MKTLTLITSLAAMYASPLTTDLFQLTKGSGPSVAAAWLCNCYNPRDASEHAAYKFCSTSGYCYDAATNTQAVSGTLRPSPSFTMETKCPVYFEPTDHR